MLPFIPALAQAVSPARAPSAAGTPADSGRHWDPRRPRSSPCQAGLSCLAGRWCPVHPRPCSWLQALAQPPERSRFACGQGAQPLPAGLIAVSDAAVGAQQGTAVPRPSIGWCSSLIHGVGVLRAARWDQSQSALAPTQHLRCHFLFSRRTKSPLH